MRRHSKASLSLAVVAVSVSLAACSGEAADSQAQMEPVGAEFMAQEAPRVPRPGSVILGPKMDPTEASGRYPFYWTRAIYSGYGRRGRRGFGGGGSWATDFPKGDRQFLVVLQRLVGLNAYDWENAVSLADPNLRRFPVVYAVEVGRMDMTEEEVLGLRSYLDAGGFLIVDDFWGQREWDNFEYNIRRVYPDRPIIDIGLDHPVYSAYYDIEEVLQVPAIGRGVYGPTAECYGCRPAVRGMYDDEGRLQVMINFNTDLGDAWEWAEDPRYPLEYSTYAYEMGANMIVYAMSH